MGGGGSSRINICMYTSVKMEKNMPLCLFIHCQYIVATNYSYVGGNDFYFSAFKINVLNLGFQYFSNKHLCKVHTKYSIFLILSVEIPNFHFKNRLAGMT